MTLQLREFTEHATQYCSCGAVRDKAASESLRPAENICLVCYKATLRTAERSARENVTRAWEVYRSGGSDWAVYLKLAWECYWHPERRLKTLAQFGRYVNVWGDVQVQGSRMYQRKGRK